MCAASHSHITAAQCCHRMRDTDRSCELCSCSELSSTIASTCVYIALHSDDDRVRLSRADQWHTLGRSMHIVDVIPVQVVVFAHPLTRLSSGRQVDHVSRDPRLQKLRPIFRVILLERLGQT